MFFSIPERVLYDRLAADPEIVTSLRYLSRDEKNSMNQLATIACRKLGLLKKGEPFDPETKLSKMVFVVAQLFYTLVSFLYGPASLFQCIRLSHTRLLYIDRVWLKPYLNFR